MGINESERHPHPPPIGSLESLWDFGQGRKLRKDAKGGRERVGFGRQELHQSAKSIAKLKRQQKTQSWRKHQSVALAERGRCSYHGCPGRRAGKAIRKRAYTSCYMSCEECSALAKKNVWYCNDTKGSGKNANQCFAIWHIIINSTAMVL